MINLGSVALLAALAAGQADKPAEHMKIFEPLIGQWVYIGETQGDTPGIGPKGTEFGSTLTYNWVINNSAVEIHWRGKSADRQAVQFVELVGWDPKERKLVSQGFSSFGGVEYNVWNRDGDVVRLRNKGCYCGR